MTALIFSLREEQVIIAMDTLAANGDTKAPYFFTSKIYPLPHLGGVMCGTGVGDFAIEWFGALKRFVAKDIHHLDQYVTPKLREIGARMGIGEKNTATVYHFGFSRVENRYV